MLLGSPPRGRGKAFEESVMDYMGRITPAWAGKSILQTSTTKREKDHPRMGGEKSAALKSDTTATGSPPHGRGKADTRAFESAFPRITPAWAGKRLHLDVKDKPAQDHPRMGGEKLAFPAILARELGSPPHGRGKEHAAPAGHTAAGITPAWAGKRDIVGPFFHYPEDHPRMGGEKTVSSCRFILGQGSPPHGRGKADNPPTTEKKGGITPAWAGKRSPVRQLFYLQ